MSKKKKKDDKEKSEASEPTEETLDEKSESEAYNWEGLEPEEASKIIKGLEALVPGILKKTVAAGVENLLLSEEGIQKLVANKKLPKEAASFLLNQADGTRKEVLRIASNEMRVFLENMDFGGELAKILTTLSFEIKTEVRFIPNEERVVPQVKNRVKMKRNGVVVEEQSSDSTEEEQSESLDDNGSEASDEKPRGFARWALRRKLREEE